MPWRETICGFFFAEVETMASTNETLEALLAKPTADVPEVGRVCFALSRNASYAAAARGEIPTIKIGRLLKVPTKALERMLDSAAAA